MRLSEEERILVFEGFVVALQICHGIGRTGRICIESLTVIGCVACVACVCPQGEPRRIACHDISSYDRKPACGPNWQRDSGRISTCERSAETKWGEHLGSVVYEGATVPLAGSGQHHGSARRCCSQTPTFRERGRARFRAPARPALQRLLAPS